MPQYKKIQYGLKQYGLFIPKGDITQSGRWKFIRARFGIVKRGKTYWLYQHSSVTIKGAPKRMRLSTNLQERIAEEQQRLRGQYTYIRMKTNKGTDWVTSQMIERRGRAE